MNCKYHDPVRNQCGSGEREDWDCDGEGCPVQKPFANKKREINHEDY